MSLSAGTLLVFLLLIPGLIFRAALYQGATVVRPIFASGALHSTVAVLFYSSSVYAVCYGLFALASRVMPGPQIAYSDVLGVVVRSDGASDETIRLYLMRHPALGLAALVVVCLTAVGAAWSTQKLSFVNRPLARVMYGPLAYIFRKSDTIALCSILTTQGEGKAFLMYQGIPVEVSLNDKNGVNHVVLQAAYRMNMVIEEDGCVARTDRRERVTSAHRDLLLIDSEHIANVHFETFTASDVLNRKTAPRI